MKIKLLDDCDGDDKINIHNAGCQKTSEIRLLLDLVNRRRPTQQTVSPANVVVRERNVIDESNASAPAMTTTTATTTTPSSITTSTTTTATTPTTNQSQNFISKTQDNSLVSSGANKIEKRVEKKRVKFDIPAEQHSNNGDAGDADASIDSTSSSVGVGDDELHNFLECGEGAEQIDQRFAQKPAISEPSVSNRSTNTAELSDFAQLQLLLDALVVVDCDNNDERNNNQVSSSTHGVDDLEELFAAAFDIDDKAALQKQQQQERKDEKLFFGLSQSQFSIRAKFLRSLVFEGFVLCGICSCFVFVVFFFKKNPIHAELLFWKTSFPKNAATRMI